MVIRKISTNPRQRGSLIAEIVVAMGVLVIAILPLAYAATSDAHRLRATYQKAVAREILDGEIELLASGGWQHISEGIHEYKVTANAATNLPAGNFHVSRNGNILRLEWRSAKKGGIGNLSREVKLK